MASTSEPPQTAASVISGFQAASRSRSGSSVATARPSSTGMDSSARRSPTAPASTSGTSPGSPTRPEAPGTSTIPGREGSSVPLARSASPPVPPATSRGPCAVTSCTLSAPAQAAAPACSTS